MRNSKKRTAAVEVAQEKASSSGQRVELGMPTLCWESFFRCQRSPVLRSEVLTALLSGSRLEVLRLPTSLLLDVLLLATAAREECNAEIVDDYESLRSRVAEEWKRPDWSTRVFDQLHANKASCILHGQTEFVCLEDAYIPGMVAWYLGQEVPKDFVEAERVVGKRVQRRKAA